MINALDFTDEEAYLAACDEEAAGLATPVEAMREYAANIGDDPRYIERAWILTDYDVWVKNPHYAGPPQPHPEDDADDAAREAQGDERGPPVPFFCYPDEVAPF